MKDMVPIDVDGLRRNDGRREMECVMVEFDGSVAEVIHMVANFDDDEFDRLTVIHDLINSRMVHYDWKNPDREIGSYQERWIAAVKKVLEELYEME